MTTSAVTAFVRLPIHRLDIKQAFETLSPREKLYAHHLSRAVWHGTRIILRQVSPEAIGIYDFILELYSSCSGEWDSLVREELISREELKILVNYAATFLSNIGNYYGSGDQKFILNVGTAALSKLAEKSIRLNRLLQDILKPLTSVPPHSLGYPSETALSAYYPETSAILQEEIASVSKVLEANSIWPENTRVRKIENAERPTYQVLQASIDQDDQRDVFPLNDESQATVQLIRGDHREELSKIHSALSEAINYAASDKQSLCLSQYQESFRTGSLDTYRESQRTWLADKGPRVENVFGFVEPYRDPYGIRAEFEGLVAIADTEETMLLKNLVDNSSTFIQRLPWTTGWGSGKTGPFEKDHFEPPDFASIHSESGKSHCIRMAYLTSCSLGILLKHYISWDQSTKCAYSVIEITSSNRHKYNDIREQCGFKNVIIANRMSAESSTTQISPFISPSEAAIFQKHKYPAYYWWVVLHELLGHGTGRLMAEESPSQFNFDINNPPVNPLTGKPIDSWYKAGQTWTGQFGDLATTVDECCAELVGAYLMDDPELLKLFGYHEKSDITAQDLTYNIYLQLGVDGLRGLANYNYENEKWGQAHSRAHFSILKYLLTSGGGCVRIDYDMKRQSLIVRVDQSKIVPEGKRALGNMLLRLHMYRVTADVHSCREYYEELSRVEGEYLLWRKVVLKNRQPRWVFVQANTFVNGSNVELREYEATPEGVIKSWAERHV